MASLIKRVSSALNSAITAWKDSTSSDIALLPTASYSQGNIQVFGSEVAWHDFNSSTNIEKALDECPPISYILYKKALAFGNGKLTATNLKGEEIKDLSKLKNYNLLKNPNFMQTDLQFRISIKITIEAYGYCPVLQIKGKFGEILSMWILPPRYVKFYKSGKLFYQLKYVDIFDKITFNDKEIPKDDVYLFTDITPYMTDMHLPASRLYNLGRIVTNISENYKARAFLMKNRGAVGILSNGSGDKFGYVPMSPGERNEVQQDFRKSYNLNSSDWNIIISNKTLTWTPMSYPIKDLMMTEQEEHDIKTICDALGYPHPLLARGANTSFNNQITSERTLYQNAIIPESLNYDLQINGMLEAQKGGIIWGYDFSHLPVLQSDMLLNERTSSIKTSRIKMQWTMGAITYNQMLLELDLEPVSNGDYYYIESQEYKDSIMPKTANNGQ